MGLEKIFKRVLIIVLITIPLLNAAIAHAEIYEGVGEYFMTNETQDFAKNHAEVDAERNILNKICVYVKSQSTMIDNALDEDEIITITAGILRVIDTKFSMTPEDDGILVKSFVTAQIDVEELEILLDNAIKAR